VFIETSFSPTSWDVHLPGLLDKAQDGKRLGVAVVFVLTFQEFSIGVCIACDAPGAMNG